MNKYFAILAAAAIVCALTVQPAKHQNVIEQACDCTDSDIGCLADCLEPQNAQAAAMPTPPNDLGELPPMD